MAQRIVYISKLLSLMLRHRPDEFALEVDRHGFVELDAVLGALRDRDSSFTLEDIEEVVYDEEKQRFEIADNRIRARYGHSFSIDLGLDPVVPPEFLYKGVDSADVERVLADGLIPEDRDYVHLSFEADVAARLSTRPGRRGSVIRIDAARAHGAEVHFYDCGPTILTKHVPAEFLALERGGLNGASQVSQNDVGQSDTNSKENVSYGRRRRFSSRR